MADVDIDPFGNHNKTCQNIPFNPGGEGSIWEPEREEY